MLTATTTPPGEFLVSERFKSLQGEGVWTGTPMAFIRFVGCSVGKKTCHACDTDFERAHKWKGGGTYQIWQLYSWSYPYKHVCLTGGEPLDHPDLIRFFQRQRDLNRPAPDLVHVETSGTRPSSLKRMLETLSPSYVSQLWLTVSPKPGYLEETIADADEIKVIVPGLGSGEGWPTVEDALRWADSGKPVFLQPRNGRHDVDPVNLQLCLELVREYPTLRLSTQMHKLWRVR